MYISYQLPDQLSCKILKNLFEMHLYFFLLTLLPPFLAQLGSSLPSFYEWGVAVKVTFVLSSFSLPIYSQSAVK